MHSNHEADTQSLFPEWPLLQEVATARNLCFLGKPPIPCAQWVLKTGCYSKQQLERGMCSQRRLQGRREAGSSAQQQRLGPPRDPAPTTPVSLGRDVHFMPVSKDTLIFPKPSLAQSLYVSPDEGAYVPFVAMPATAVSREERMLWDCSC